MQGLIVMVELGFAVIKTPAEKNCVLYGAWSQLENALCVTEVLH